MAGPLTFAETLEQLGAWERHRVTVRAFTQTWRELVPHAHTHMHGRLGAAQMGSSSGPVRRETAYFALGPSQHGDSRHNGFFLRSDDFVHATQLNGTHLNIDCGHDLHIEVQLG
jgi:hypothetical protein